MKKNINYYTRDWKLPRLNYFKFDRQLATYRNEIRKTIHLVYHIQPCNRALPSQKLELYNYKHYNALLTF